MRVAPDCPDLTQSQPLLDSLPEESVQNEESRYSELDVLKPLN